MDALTSNQRCTGCDTLHEDGGKKTGERSSASPFHLPALPGSSGRCQEINSNVELI